MFFLYCHCLLLVFFFFFFNDTATTEIYTLSLHDALPISILRPRLLPKNNAHSSLIATLKEIQQVALRVAIKDRKSTRLNSSHLVISYAVFCLKKKKYLKGTDHSARLRTTVAHH